MCYGKDSFDQLIESKHNKKLNFDRRLTNRTNFLVYQSVGFVFQAEKNGSFNRGFACEEKQPKER